MADANDTTERWLPVPGWEGLYDVSDMGRVKSLARKVLRRYHGWQAVPECILKGRVDKSGYLYVALSRPGRTFTVKVHRLVLLAFHGTSAQALSGDHINGDRLDNRAANLRFCTPAENSANMRRLGRQARGEKNSHAKLTADDVIEIRSRYSAGNISQPTLARLYGVTHPTIGFIVRRRAWKHVP